MSSLLRVLHLEDNPDDTRLAKEILAADGVACEFVRVDTRVAFDVELRKPGYDLILADYTLPAFDGLAALAMAREECPCVPFIILSGTLGEELAIDAVKGGATDYVLKHRLSRLAPAVRRALHEAAEHAQRGRAEDALCETETRFQATFEQAAVGIVHVMPDGRFLRVNQRFADIVGYTAEELSARTIQQITCPDDLAADRHNVHRLLAEERRTCSTEKRFVRKNGTLVWVDITISAVRDARGGWDYLIVVVQDITARKEAETALARRTQELETLLDNAPDVIARFDRQLRYLLVNRQWSKVFGHASPAALGRTCRDLGCVPGDCDLCDCAVPRAFKTGQMQEVEFVLKTVSGDRRLHARVVPEPAGGPATEAPTALVIARDVTEQRQLEEELSQSQKMEVLGQLAGGIAHDINNALTAISGYAALARVQLPAGHAGEYDLRQLEETALQTAGIVKGLLTFSHKTPTCLQPVELRGALANAIRFLARLLPASIEVVVNGTDGPPLWVLADSAQLQQIVMNLAVNSRDAMLDGGTLRITLQADESAAAQGDVGPPPPRFAQLIVSDTGCGIPSDILPHVFSPLFTTKPPGQGTGLGLTIVQGIVERHGGAIQVRSEPGEGTTFTIRLPCTAPAPADAAALRAAPARGRGELVLIVDDNVQVLDVITSGLRQMGYDARRAASATAALAQSARYGERVRLAIIDVDLPGDNGLNVLRKIRLTRPALPALIITGNVDHDLDAEQQKRTYLFQKPFRLADLLQKVTELLEQPVEAEVRT